MTPNVLAALTILTAGLALLVVGCILDLRLSDAAAPVPTEDSNEWDRLRAAVDGPDFQAWEREWSA
jgi:hypothetical protein